MNLSDVDAGSYDSRKFILTLAGTVLITGYAIAAAFVPSMPSILPTFIGGILGVLGLYFGINVANKLVMSRASTAQLAITDSAANSAADAITKCNIANDLQLKTANGQIVGAQKTEGNSEDKV